MTGPSPAATPLPGGALLLPVAAGAGVAGVWVWLAGGEALLAVLRSVQPAGAVGMVALTAAWFFLRFLRSQFLLRRGGVRIPERPALATYLAAIPGTATPAYVGEAIRSAFLRRRFAAPVRLTLPLLVLERLLDVAALGLLIVLLPGTGSGVLGLLFLAGSTLLGLLLVPIWRRLGVTPAVLARLRRPAVLAVSLGASLVAWALAALLYPLAAWSVGIDLPTAEGMAVFARSTLLGALTLLPAGVGATGSLAILDLGTLGVPLVPAVSVVTLARGASVGLAMAVGTAFLVRELRRVPAVTEGVAHFDEIAREYAAQWSPHVWDLLLERKVGLLADALPAPPARAGLGIDLGCGLGLQATAMHQRGYRVVGVDPSTGLLARRPERAVPVAAGDALRLPLASASVDFVYAVGVWHHLPGRVAQEAALAEVARVLRPGGRLLIHESNPRNPLFRFYMSYLFPILKRIDEGTEWWIDPRHWAGVSGFRLQTVRYFTFLPDFTPAVLLRPAMALERALERGPTAPWSAHYLAVMERTPDPTRPTGSPREATARSEAGA